MKKSDPSGRVIGTSVTRRDVLRGLGGLALAGPTALLASTGRAAGLHSLVPAVPNRAYPVPDLQAYAQKSVRAGETIDFRVSSPVDYQLSIERLGWNVDRPTPPERPSKDWVVHRFPQEAASPRSVRPGSYVHVERALHETTPLPQLTLECWVRPFRDVGADPARGAYQGLITQYSYPAAAGFGLFIASNGRPQLYFGDGGAYSAGWLVTGSDVVSARQWTHLCAVFDAGVARLYQNGLLVATQSGLPVAVTPGPQPLRLGAYGQNGHTDHFLDGDLAMPAVYERALGVSEIFQRSQQLPPGPASNSVGCWPLDEETGVDLRDLSGCDRHGVIVNRGTWMIGGPGFADPGPGFHASDVDRHDTLFVYDPDADPERGHGLRLSRADFYDCAWPVSHSYTLPTHLLPGVYVGRITPVVGSTYDVTFVVKKATNRPVAPILVVCATTTWQAYNPTLASVSAIGGFSFYRSHHHPWGQPTYYLGENVPCPSADPYAVYITDENQGLYYSHLVRAERYTHVWLEQNGYDYDVVSDRDLHDDPGLLSQYAVVMIVGHSEYWSREAYLGVRAHLARGGRLIVGSGNTMFWRVSYDDDVTECRKAPVQYNLGGRTDWFGEVYHEHDHERGGLMREAGLPAWNAIGLESAGWGSPFVPFEVTEPEHEFFRSPEPISVSVGSDLGGPFAVGHEWDILLTSTPGDHNPDLPDGYGVPTVLAMAESNTWRWDYRAQRHPPVDPPVPPLQTLSEIIDWDWPGGGRLLNVGSIAAGRALHDDGKMAALFRNALHHFDVRFRLNAVAIGQDGTFQDKSFDGESWAPALDDWQGAGGGFGNHAPTLVMWAPDRIAAMAITQSGDLRYRFWDGSAWSAWTTLGSGFTGRPAAVGWGRNRLQLFARGFDSHLYEYAWDGTSWSGWTSLGSGIVEDPSAEWWEGDHLGVATLGPNGEVLYKWYSDGAWYPTPTSWQDLGGNFAHAPTLMRWNGNFFDIFAVDAAGAGWRKSWDGTSWNPSLSGWEYLGGGLASRVAAIATRGPDEFSLFAIGTDGHLKAKWWSGSSWGPTATDWQDLGGDLVGDPAAASYRRNSVSVLATGSNGRAQHRYWDGFSWSTWQDMGGALRPSPALLPWVSTASAAAPAVPIGPATGILVGTGLMLAGRHALRQDPLD